MSHTVSKFLFTIFGVELQDDKLWVILNIMILFVFGEDNVPTNTHLNDLMTLFYVHQNYKLFI
jgi:hypothetical protein